MIKHIHIHENSQSLPNFKFQFNILRIRFPTTGNYIIFIPAHSFLDMWTYNKKVITKVGKTLRGNPIQTLLHFNLGSAPT